MVRYDSSLQNKIIALCYDSTLKGHSRATITTKGQASYFFRKINKSI